MNNEQITKQILEKFKKKQIGWLQLDTSFENYIDHQELSAVNDFYVDHREGENHKGWQSCCVHGLGITKTQVSQQYGHVDELNAPYYWTALAKLAPKATEFWKNFPAEKFTRVRFMKLAPNGYVGLHNDFPTNMLDNIDLLDYLLPINCSITHPKDCIMEIENHGIVPWKPGSVFLINILNNHTVKNNSAEDRIHMIAQAHVGNQREKFCELIARSVIKNGIL